MTLAVRSDYPNPNFVPQEISMADTLAALRQYIQDNFMLGSTGAKVGDGDSFMQANILDSTGFLELIAHLEETYGITVKDEEMIPENLDSLNSLAAFIARKRVAGSLIPSSSRGTLHEPIAPRS